ncbi:MAG: hypothetical protein R3F56_16595 [Planctomycetota bacterium]
MIGALQRPAQADRAEESGRNRAPLRGQPEPRGARAATGRVTGRPPGPLPVHPAGTHNVVLPSPEEATPNLVPRAASVVAQVGALVLAASLVRAQTHQPGRAAGNAAVAPGQASVGYVADFDNDGMSFPPALGRRAPRNFPLRLSLASIRRGGRDLFDRAQGRAEPLTGDGHRVEFVRSGGIVERYDSLPEGVEMSWVFRARPEGAGDLIVRARIETDLVAVPVTDRSAGLRFAAVVDGEAIGGVSIGAVTGIDAAGDRVAGQLRLEDGHLAMSLPGDFLDRARYPVVLDPLVATAFRVSIANEVSNNPDVAYDSATNLYCIVWEEPLSATDVRIFARRIHADTGAWMGLHQISASGEVSRNPTIANVSRTGCFVVAWERTNVPVVGTEVVARRYFAAGSGPEAVTLLVQPGGRNPDLGGDPSGEDDEAVVVYEHDIGPSQVISAADLRTDSTIRVWTRLEIERGTGLRNPAISKSFDTRVGGPNYMVVWEVRPGRIQTSEIRFRLISRDMGFVSDARWSPIPSDPQYEPDVAGDGDTFLVVAEQRDSDPSRAVTMTWVSHSGVNYDSRALTTAAEPACREPCVAYLGENEYMVTSRMARAPGSGFYNLRFESRRVWATETVGTPAWESARHGYVQTVAPSSGSTIRRHEIVGHASGTQTQDLRAFAVFESDDGNRVNLYGQRYEAPGSGGSVSDLGGRCPPQSGRSLSAQGAFGLGTSALEISGGSLPGGAYLHMGLAAPPIGCGPCAFLVPVVNLWVGVPQGHSRVAIQVPIEPDLVGGAVDFQVLVPLGSGGACPIVPGLWATNVLRVVVGR